MYYWKIVNRKCNYCYCCGNGILSDYVILLMMRSMAGRHDATPKPILKKIFSFFFLSSSLLYVSVCMRAGLSSPCSHTYTQGRQQSDTVKRMKQTFKLYFQVDDDNACYPSMQQNPPVRETVRAIYQTTGEQTEHKHAEMQRLRLLRLSVNSVSS